MITKDGSMHAMDVLVQVVRKCSLKCTLKCFCSAFKTFGSTRHAYDRMRSVGNPSLQDVTNK